MWIAPMIIVGVPLVLCVGGFLVFNWAFTLPELPDNDIDNPKNYQDTP